MTSALCVSSSSSFEQGAFTACAKVSELQVFPQTPEVKVDPDKPLEGARLAVLQVALQFGGQKNNQPLVSQTLCFSFFFLFQPLRVIKNRCKFYLFKANYICICSAPGL